LAAAKQIDAATTIAQSEVGTTMSFILEHRLRAPILVYNKVLADVNFAIQRIEIRRVRTPMNL